MSNIDEQIRTLVMQASDPKDKAYLLLLQQLSSSLMDNTYATQRLEKTAAETAAKLGAHITSFDAWKNRGQGAMKVGMGVLAVAQVIIGYAYVSFMASDSDQTKQIQSLLQTQLVLKTKIESLERSRDNLSAMTLDLSRRLGPGIVLPTTPSTK